MELSEILKYCLENLKDTILVNTYGEKAIFYNPNLVLKKGVYVLTIKEKDGKNDKSSELNRIDTFRVNIGVKKDTFKELFGFIPSRPSAGCTVDMKYDFTRSNEILPHPVYAWMSWISIINPTESKFEELKPFIEQAYLLAVEKFNKKVTTP